jgi:hypothetical protein
MAVCVILSYGKGGRLMPLTKTHMMMFNGRSAKPWGSLGEAAANLEMVALDSRVSKATRLHAGVLLFDDDD